MLTRLQIRGFKNLVDVDVRFGPFTCIAGANGVGKSNLLDAIAFLSALANKSLIDAALSVRDESGRTGDVRSLFHHFGDQYAAEMMFVAEMVIPREGYDDLGQEARASSTFLRYELALRYRQDSSTHTLGGLEISSEILDYIKRGDSGKHLLFPHSREWEDSAVVGRRWTPHFISTDIGKRVIKVHQDGGSSGKARSLLASNLPRTALSAANAAESPTVTLAKREMQSWRMLQLEPSALRQPDDFTAPTKLSTDGAHLAATLYHLARNSKGALAPQPKIEVYAEVANKLSQLIPDVRSVYVDRDERRELLTLYIAGRDGTAHPARALSDGTLRFLALAILAIDTHSQGVLCLEEPENGIYPDRIPAMIQLLQDLTTNVQESIGSDNPLRQVIINTHSPAVVAQVPDDSLLMAELIEEQSNGTRFSSLQLRGLEDTWRHPPGDKRMVSKGKLISYLNPIEPKEIAYDHYDNGGFRRVIDRPEIRQYALFSSDEK